MKTLITTIALLTASITTAQAATGCINYSEQIEGRTVYLASICYKNSNKAEIRELFIKEGLQGLLDAGHKVADQAQLDAMTEAANLKDDNEDNVREEVKASPVAPSVNAPVVTKPKYKDGVTPPSYYEGKTRKCRGRGWSRRCSWS
jgi:hypothetical protein